MHFRNNFYFLSNMYPCTLKGNLHTYNCAEHAFAYAKCVNDKDRATILACKDGYSAKKAGRIVVLRPDWHSIKLRVMDQVLRMKFHPGTELSQKLIDTGDLYLQEDNTWNDTFWGVCNGVGQNNLGKILMKIRSQL